MDLIKYHNDINKINFSHFKEKEIDVLFALMLKAKESVEDQVIISYADFNKLIGEESNKARLKNYILNTSINLKKITQVIELPNGNIEIFSLFDKITIDTNEKNIIFKINKDFSYLLNGLLNNFTIFDLKELIALKGNYPKTLFRLLKQWESTKGYIVKIDNFIELMGIPKTYKVFTIRQKVLKPCLEQLGKYFHNLELVEIKKGRSVETLKFTWKSKKKNKKEQILEINPIKKKKSIGEKEYEEHNRIELEKSIKTLENDKKIGRNQVKNKKNISKEEYEELYQKYLEKIGETHNIFIRRSFDFVNTDKYNVG